MESVIIILVIIFIIYILSKIGNRSPKDYKNLVKKSYKIPKVITIDDIKYNNKTLNDVDSLKHLLRGSYNTKDDNIMASRWASKNDLPGNLSNGSVNYENIDIIASPKFLHHLTNEKNTTDRYNVRLNVITGGFADDTLFDEVPYTHKCK